MTHVLRARRLLTEEGWLDDHQLRIADGVIAAIEPIPVGVTERDAELLCPAYIDTHVHGGAGVDVMDDAGCTRQAGNAQGTRRCRQLVADYRNRAA